ncbi:MAG: M48 family metalloprotease [Desulfobulbus sp.]|uniref:M48 family metalloprotease n=1 Tax=Desulfobulbus sp. TaxID=895 RepID=UPI00284AC4AD|nr:M48 family metalloprotease [Desulfobulbus sp.]MDR2549680.1 M48 family metalloprotease [Desulfobulbus sp.]
MLYTNLLYFLVAIFVFSTNTPVARPVLPLLWTLAALAAVYWGFSRLAARMFNRPAAGASGYFSTEKKLSLLAVLVFAACIYLLDLKYYLKPLSLGGALPVLTDAAGLGCFFLLLVMMWLAARPSYLRLFQCSYSRSAFVRSNIKANLPIVLPWLTLSLVFDCLLLLPIPGLAGVLRSSWGDLVLFALFLFFLVLVFPPLVRTLWGCTPLPPGPRRDRLQAFCRSQQFDTKMYLWPLFEGQVLTAGIMGIVPQLRYLLVTPALLETLNEEELDSVLAHEIGHVKHRHLLLYVLLFLGFSLLAGAVAKLLPHLILSSDFFYRLLSHLSITPGNLLGVLASLPLLVLLLVYFRFVFGYFVRNFERQADVYVFRALGTGAPLIRAFEKIVLFGGGSREEKNWHHFGIGERIDFLQRCEDDRSLIDRHSHRLRLHLIAYCLCIALGVFFLQRIDVGKLSEGYETKYAEAVLLQKARLEPGNSLWPMYLGDFLQSRKMEQRAIEAYERALALAPLNAELNNNLAWLLVTAQDKSVRDPEQALSLAHTAALLKEHGYVLDTLAMAYWANGLAEEAVATELKAIRLDPDNKAYYQGQIERFRLQKWDE